MMKATYSGSSISQEEWDRALELAERWKHVTDGAQYGEAGKNLGVLARAFQHLKVCYDEMVKIHADTPLPEGLANDTLPALPGQKALTFLMQQDESAKQADALIDLMLKGHTTFSPAPISQHFFHQLRLRVAKDPSLIDKIAVYYLTPDRQWREVGLRYEDELRWPEGFCLEAWEKEVEISTVRHGRSPLSPLAKPE